MKTFRLKLVLPWWKLAWWAVTGKRVKVEAWLRECEEELDRCVFEETLQSLQLQLVAYGTVVLRQMEDGTLKEGSE